MNDAAKDGKTNGHLEVVEGVLMKGDCVLSLRDRSSGAHWVCRGSTFDDALAAVPQRIHDSALGEVKHWLGRAPLALMT